MIRRPHVTGMSCPDGTPHEVQQTFRDSIALADGILVAGTADWHEYVAMQPTTWRSTMHPEEHAAEAYRLRKALAAHRAAGHHTGVVVKADARLDALHAWLIDRAMSTLDDDLDALGGDAE